MNKAELIARIRVLPFPDDANIPDGEVERALAMLRAFWVDERGVKWISYHTRDDDDKWTRQTMKVQPLPSFDELRGIVTLPDGVSSEEYVRRVRDEWDGE